MTRTKFSLVIPTYNRAATLKRSVIHLLQLEGILDCEIIIVDDGSTDETAVILKSLEQTGPVPIKVITMSNGGPARARNAGLRAASNDRILFIDDDVFPRQGMLQSHWKKLNAGYTGSQGVLLWHEEIELTGLIRYIDSRGSQFAFDRIKAPENLGFAYVYTGNFAVLKSAVLEVGGFDESFFSKEHKFSAFEDTILGYRLKQDGARLAFAEEAIADHLHHMSEEGYLQREYKVGYCIGLLQQQYPGIARSLRLDRKGWLVAPQLFALHVINMQVGVSCLLGYAFSMRLRHREAFYRGYGKFVQETAQRPQRASQ